MKFYVYMERYQKMLIEADSADEARAKVRKARPKCIITKTKLIREGN